MARIEATGVCENCGAPWHANLACCEFCGVPIAAVGQVTGSASSRQVVGSLFDMIIKASR